MKRLVLCFDGTWQARPSYRRYSAHPTNVEKTHVAVLKQDARGTHQITAYYRGIGTDRFSRLARATTGLGISLTICDAYAFIVDNFTLGTDELYLFGFSRGAYTARSLSGFMQWIGVVKKEHLPDLPDYYAQYHLPEPQRDPKMRGEQLQMVRQGDQSIPIRFLGVWDTVGALGLPIPLVGRLFRRYVGFHDTELSRNVSHAFHALAVHEHRSKFAPSLWSRKNGGQVMEQAWFPGTHCDVGGGSPKSGLSDIAFLWMLRHAEGLGLEFDRAHVARTTQPDCRSDIYNSSRGVWRLTPRRVRRFGTSIEECRHGSIDERIQYLQANPPKRYRRKWRDADMAVQRMTRCGDLLLQKLRFLVAQNVVDPNVNLFLGVLENNPDQVRAALAQGADVDITDKALLDRYAAILSAFRD